MLAVCVQNGVTGRGPTHVTVKVAATYEVLVLFMSPLQTSCWAVSPTALPGESFYLHYKRITAWPGSPGWDLDRAPPTPEWRVLFSSYK